MQITAAGNTEVPADLVLVAKGYEITHRDHDGAWLRDERMLQEGRWTGACGYFAPIGERRSIRYVCG